MQASSIRRFLADDRGATAVEYGLIAVLIAIALLGSFAIMGNAVITLMDDGAGGAANVIARQNTVLD